MSSYKRTANPDQSLPIHPLLALCFGILAVSTSSILIRFAQAGAPSLVIAALRLSFATLVLSPYALTRRREEISGLSKHEFILLGLSGVFLALHFASWITSLELTTVASSVVFVSTTPLWVALVSALFLHESISWRVIVGLIIALAGGLLVGAKDICSFNQGILSCRSVASLLQGDAFWGNLLALGGAIFGGGYLTIGRRLRSKVSSLTYTFLVYGIAALVLVIFAWVRGFNLLVYPLPIYLLCLILALVPQLLGHSTFNWALRYLSAVFVSIALLGEPIGSTILAFFILNEIPSSLELLGGAFILLGIIVAAQSQNKK